MKNALFSLGKKGTDIELYSCCFTGHRILPRPTLPYLRANLLRSMAGLIEGKGVRFFYSGAALGFDTLAAECVLTLKARYPHIQLILVLPCRTQAERWKSSEQERYYLLCSQADKVVVLAEEYTDGCMQRRNRFLVEHSAYCIYYQTHSGGGTGYTLNYAKKRGLILLPVMDDPYPFLEQLTL